LIWKGFESWLLAFSSSTLAPRSISLDIVFELTSWGAQSKEDQQYIIRRLHNSKAVELREFKVIVSDEEGGSPPRRLLLVDWKRGDTNLPQLIDPMVKIEEKCCAVVSGGILTFE
jgi:hypothetical protein